MSELERRLRATAHAASTAASSARAPREIKRSITRRRGLTLGSAGVAAAVVIGSVAVGGLGLTDTPELPSLTPTPTPDLTLDRGALDYATVPLATGSTVFGDIEPLGATLCGQPAPEQSTRGDDFTAAFDEIPETMELDNGFAFADHSDPFASVTVTYGATEPLPAFVGGLTALFVQDGFVVGFSNSSQAEVVNTFMPDQTRTYPWRWDGWTNSCHATPDNPMLPAGDYEVVWVGRVKNDLATAAQWSLRQDGYSLPGVADLEAFREGSYYCEQWHMMDTYEPITCHPNALVGFDLDAQANTATIPYDTSYYVRDVDITFASAPVRATLTGEYPAQSQGFDESVYEPGTTATCGEFFRQVAASDANLSGEMPLREQLPAPGDTVEASLWRWSYGWSEARVTVPAQSRIWLTRTRVVDEAIQDGDSTVHITYYGHEVVGWLDVESATASPVEIKIYDGPAPWPLTVTDAQWCAGHDGEGAHSALADPYLTGFVESPVAATFDDGSHYQDVAIMLSARLFS